MEEYRRKQLQQSQPRTGEVQAVFDDESVRKAELKRQRELEEQKEFERLKSTMVHDTVNLTWKPFFCDNNNSILSLFVYLTSNVFSSSTAVPVSAYVFDFSSELARKHAAPRGAADPAAAGAQARRLGDREAA